MDKECKKCIDAIADLLNILWLQADEADTETVKDTIDEILEDIQESNTVYEASLRE